MNVSDTYDNALETIRDLTSVEKYWNLNSKEINLHDLKTLVRDQAITSYRSGYNQGKRDTELRTSLGQNKIKA